MRVTLERLDGVDSAAMSLNEGRARIQLKPGNLVTLARLRESVERNGFTPKEARVTARVDVVARGDRLQLRIAGLAETYEVVGTPQADKVREELKKHAGHAVLVEGVIPVLPDKQALPIMQVRAVRAVGAF